MLIYKNWTSQGKSPLFLKKIWKHLIIKIRRDFSMLCESQKVALIGLLNGTKKKRKIKLLAAALFYLIQPPAQIHLWLYCIILCLPRVALHECKSSWDKNKTSATKPCLPNWQLKVHQLHTSIEIQTSNLCHIWCWNILPCVFFLAAVHRFAHLDNKVFPLNKYFLKVIAFELLLTSFLFIRLRNSVSEYVS